jgi:hypothetical protein
VKKKDPHEGAVYNVHPAAELFPLMDDSEFGPFVEDIRVNGQQEPIVIWQEKPGVYWLIDGRNRLRACQKLEVAPRLQYILSPSFNPVTFIISRNLHRRHLTAEQKRTIIAAALKADPSQSNRAIAEKVKADDKTVGKIRKQLESTAECPQLQKTTGKDGKARTAKRPIAKVVESWQRQDGEDCHAWLTRLKQVSEEEQKGNKRKFVDIHSTAQREVWRADDRKLREQKWRDRFDIFDETEAVFQWMIARREKWPTTFRQEFRELVERCLDRMEVEDKADVKLGLVDESCVRPETKTRMLDLLSMLTEEERADFKAKMTEEGKAWCAKHGY